jgi:hypothetical protein
MSRLDRSLDYLAIGMIGIVVPTIAFVTTGSWWLLATVLCASVYGWKTDQRDLAVAMSLAPSLMLVTTVGLAILNRTDFHLIMRDDVLGRLDGGLSVAFWRWAIRHPQIHSALAVVYQKDFQFAIAGLIFSRRRLHLMRSFLVSTALLPLCYFLCPAVGPAFAGQLGHAPNCMPSGHMTLALLLVVYTEGPLRWAMALFAFGTAAATIGVGEHYAIDLLAAVPFTWAVVALPNALRFTARSRNLEPMAAD